ncbi:sigma-54-dependent Fis family transcriptional regulator [Agaricicola taiwanensis]|uniref:DNA-binding transcriptional regulator NtrC n=1 Tax=Agaricicola taiwanensis TaxID=591372 RepID=A0A8J2VMJ5_9RHOB|nr:sigma-54 dependent transcriptional regulator [Agaricicola taiwanensis]GGE38658.1 sigma-54-dependent Fis family transcriptional regulator [Agaricicola taiwanensis]
MNATILIVEDDPVQRRLLEAMIRRQGGTPELAENGNEAVERLTGPDGGRIDAVVLDLVMPELDGMGVLEKLAEKKVNVPVIVQTANGSIDAVVAAMRAGAVDFVVKPVAPERLQVSLRNALQTSALEGEIRRLSRRTLGRMTIDDLATKSASMERAVGLARRAAASSIPVLIEGESGVGKEVLARAVAGSGDRAGKPFVAVNCGAIPGHLVESILFGHEKGAFTGATEKHIGKFQDAHGGTLLLDEVGELPLEAQVKLLRVIQEGEIDPVGGKRPVRVDVRIISATNRNLIDLVREGRFREDLYYRLSVFPIMLPPLRERRADIASLARRFAARFAAEEGRRIKGISPAALAKLEACDWPGNVRQLENAVFRAVVLAESDELSADDFPQLPALSQPSSAPAQPSAGGVRAMEERNYPHLARLIGDDGHARPLGVIEEEAIRHALDRYSGRITDVARRLGIGRSTLYRRMKELGLDAECGPDTTTGERAAG